MEIEFEVETLVNFFYCFCCIWKCVFQQGKDVVARAKTGSGKTFAYLLPLLQKLFTSESNKKLAPSAIVLVPTRELSQQVCAFCLITRFQLIMPFCISGRAWLLNANVCGAYAGLYRGFIIDRVLSSSIESCTVDKQHACSWLGVFTFYQLYETNTCGWF